MYNQWIIKCVKLKFQTYKMIKRFPLNLLAFNYWRTVKQLLDFRFYAYIQKYFYNN